MAYTDLISSQTTAVVGGATYNFAFDTPISADGSPHITHMGIQVGGTAAGVVACAEGLADIITDLRVKVGSNIIMNWNNNATKVAGAGALSQLAVLINRLGGQSYCAPTAAGGTDYLSECAWPVGLDATRSHRVNIALTLANEASMLGAAFVPATTDINVSLNYGVSTESTIVGSRQDFTMTANSTRAVTVDGRRGWQMLGVYAADSNAGAMTVDLMTEARVNNGAFRELTLAQWRALNNSYTNPDATSLHLGGQPDPNASGLAAAPTQIASQTCCLFLNLRRITAGANIDIVFTYGAVGSTLALYPIWVAPIGAGTAKAPRQTITQPQSTSGLVEANTQG